MDKFHGMPPKIEGVVFLRQKTKEDVFNYRKNLMINLDKIVLITKCPICNLFAKKILMTYNKIGLERYRL